MAVRAVYTPRCIPKIWYSEPIMEEPFVLKHDEVEGLADAIGAGAFPNSNFGAS